MWDRLTIFQKGLVLIAVPLLFQLGFVALLADMQQSNTDAVEWSMHSKNVLQQSQAVLRSLLELGTGLRGFILSSDPDLGAAYEKAAEQLPNEIGKLKDSVTDRPVQVGQVERIADRVRAYMDWHAETMRLAAGGRRDEAVARARSETNAKLQGAIVEAVLEFLRSEQRLDEERTATLERTRARQRQLLWLGAAASLLLSLGVALVFSRSVGSRLSALAANARRLAEGKELTPPLEGKDEVAQLDHDFRGMAGEIVRSAQTLRRSAEEIRNLNENLEERIQERTAELARANTALQEADRRKDDFLAMLAHELRNPLAPIRNALQIMKMPGAGPDVARRAREMMERQLHHLVRVVDDLLDVSRITQGKIELRREPVDLAAVFARAVETAQPAIEARRHRLDVALPEVPVFVRGDLVRLAQVVGNLLVNAAKYTEQAGTIWLSGAAEDGKVVVRVRDTGIGIGPELLPRVFDLFTQADNSLARSQGGLGIGLTVVKRLVELHGGTVAATSPGPGRGSEFVVCLPLLETPVDAAAGPGQAVEAPRLAPSLVPKRRVLVVDDNVDAAESAAMLLRFLGHEVAVAYDGPRALAAVCDFRPEIVLLDIGLPGMSGYDVARELRARPEGKGLVLAAVTGYGQDEDRRQAAAAGFDCHLTKPLAPGALTSFVASPESFSRPGSHD